MSVARNMRRKGLAKERRAGWQRRACPTCGGILLIRDDGRKVRHAKPECEQFKAMSNALSVSNDVPPGGPLGNP